MLKGDLFIVSKHYFRKSLMSVQLRARRTAGGNEPVVNGSGLKHHFKLARPARRAIGTLAQHFFISFNPESRGSLPYLAPLSQLDNIDTFLSRE